MPIANSRNRPVRSRSNTTSSFRGASAITEDPAEDYTGSPSSYNAPSNELRPPPSFSARSRAGSNQNSPRKELPGFDLPTRPTIRSANSAFEGGASYQGSRDASPAPSAGGSVRLTRVPTEGSIGGFRSGLRPVKRNDSLATGGGGDVFGDPDLDGEDARSVSPANSYEGRNVGMGARSSSWSVQQQQERSGYSNGGGYGRGVQRDYENGDNRGYENTGGYGDKKAAPPPPPPSRYVCTLYIPLDISQHAMVSSTKLVANTCPQSQEATATTPHEEECP